MIDGQRQVNNSVTDVLWHGRGGQGAFTAAKLLGASYVVKDRYALSFPSFGPERRGAPMRAFTKLSDKPIGDRSEIIKADYVVYLDDTLFCDCDELKPDGTIVINTKQKFNSNHIITLDGSAIAAELRLPTVNTVMLGALAFLCDIDIADIEEAVKVLMPKKICEANIQAVRRAMNVLGGKV